MYQILPNYPIILIKGGEGSGHFEHVGRPGEVGGSSTSTLSRLEHNNIRDEDVEFTDWYRTIHGSKYFSATVKIDASESEFSPTIELRHSNHMSNGDFNPDTSDREIFTKLSNDLYWENGNMNVYSGSMKSQKTVVSAIRKNSFVMNEIKESIKRDFDRLKEQNLIRPWKPFDYNRKRYIPQLELV